MQHSRLVRPRCRQRHFKRICDISRLHRGTELPADDVTREVIQNGRQIHPAPANDLEVGELGLPQLVYRRRFISELAGCLHHDKGRTGDQVIGFKQAIHRAFRDKIALGISELHRQFAR